MRNGISQIGMISHRCHCYDDNGYIRDDLWEIIYEDNNGKMTTKGILREDMFPSQFDVPEEIWERLEECYISLEAGVMVAKIRYSTAVPILEEIVKRVGHGARLDKYFKPINGQIFLEVHFPDYPQAGSCTDITIDEELVITDRDSVENAVREVRGLPKKEGGSSFVLNRQEAYEYEDGRVWWTCRAQKPITR